MITTGQSLVKNSSAASNLSATSDSGFVGSLLAASTLFSNEGAISASFAKARCDIPAASRLRRNSVA